MDNDSEEEGGTKKDKEEALERQMIGKAVLIKRVNAPSA